jgi:hypothetical protein
VTRQAARQRHQRRHRPAATSLDVSEPALRFH